MRDYKISDSNSLISYWFSYGKMILVIASLFAAKTFSLTPPILRTFPVSEISPVMATWTYIGLLMLREYREEAIAIPAEGPSLGVAPSGKWMWI